jgi:hypothetical protein
MRRVDWARYRPTVSASTIRHAAGGPVVAEVDRVLRQLARPTLTHEVLDQLPPGRTTDYMRNLILHLD